MKRILELPVKTLFSLVLVLASMLAFVILFLAGIIRFATGDSVIGGLMAVGGLFVGFFFRSTVQFFEPPGVWRIPKGYFRTTLPRYVAVYLVFATTVLFFAWALRPAGALMEAGIYQLFSRLSQGQ